MIFSSRPSIVSIQEFEADKQSLLRMLAEFEVSRIVANRSLCICALMLLLASLEGWHGAAAA